MTMENEPRNRSLAAWGRRAAIRLGTTVTAVVGIMSLCGFLAAWGWPLELLCHFRVQYSLLFLSLSVTMALLRSWRCAGICLALAVVNGWEVAPYYVGSVPGAGSPTSLRVVSANLFSGNREPEVAMEFLETCDADVIAVYEVTPAWERRLWDGLREYSYRCVEPRADNYGIALYSRLPFEAVEVVALSSGNLAIQAEFAHAGTQMRLIAAHASSPGGIRTAQRNDQLRRLGELAGESTVPVILVGDLNITPFSPSFRELCVAGGLRDGRRGHGVCASWPAGRSVLAIPIDHCLVRDCQVGFATGPDIGSDHLPLIVDVREEE